MARVLLGISAAKTTIHGQLCWKWVCSRVRSCHRCSALYSSGRSLAKADERRKILFFIGYKCDGRRPPLQKILAVVADREGRANFHGALGRGLFFIGLRLFGKRELGQFTTFDLVLVLLVANALQPAIK